MGASGSSEKEHIDTLFLNVINNLSCINRHCSQSQVAIIKFDNATKSVKELKIKYKNGIYDDVINGIPDIVENLNYALMSMSDYYIRFKVSIKDLIKISSKLNSIVNNQEYKGLEKLNNENKKLKELLLQERLKNEGQRSNNLQHYYQPPSAPPLYNCVEGT